jgi:hypothetical protein
MGASEKPTVFSRLTLRAFSVNVVLITGRGECDAQADHLGFTGRVAGTGVVGCRTGLRATHHNSRRPTRRDALRHRPALWSAGKRNLCGQQHRQPPPDLHRTATGDPHYKWLASVHSAKWNSWNHLWRPTDARRPTGRESVPHRPAVWHHHPGASLGQWHLRAHPESRRPDACHPRRLVRVTDAQFTAATASRSGCWRGPTAWPTRG